MDNNNLQVNQAVNWEEIKKIVCGIAESLQLVCAMLPAGPIKNVLCGIAGIMNLICNSIPGGK